MAHISVLTKAQMRGLVIGTIARLKYGILPSPGPEHCRHFAVGRLPILCLAVWRFAVGRLPILCLAVWRFAVGRLPILCLAACRFAVGRLPISELSSLELRSRATPNL